MNAEKERKKNLTRCFGVLWSASKESSLNKLQISVSLCEKRKKEILECVCYMVLLEILNKIQGTVHFLFALNRKAPNISVKSQKMQMFLSPCVNSLLIRVLITQSVKNRVTKLLLCSTSPCGSASVAGCVGEVRWAVV